MKKFEITNYEQYFSETVLRRGWKYYRSNNVVSVVYTDDFYIQAMVKGSEEYDIDIKIDEHLETSCTCPYGENCKHIASVIFYLNNHPIEEGIKRAVIPKTDLDCYKESILNDIYWITNGQNFFEYGTEDKFIDIVNEYLIEVSTNNDDNELSIKKLFVLLDVINTVEMDGSDGQLTVAFDNVMEALSIVGISNYEVLADLLIDYVSKDIIVFDISEIIERIVQLIDNKSDAVLMVKTLRKIVLRFFNELDNTYIKRKRDILLTYEYELLYYFEIERNVKEKLYEASFSIFTLRMLYVKILQSENNYYDLISYLEKRLGCEENTSREIDLRELAASYYQLGANEKSNTIYNLLFKEFSKLEDYLILKKINPHLKVDEIKQLLEYAQLNKSSGVYQEICIRESLFDELFTYAKNLGFYSVFDNRQYFINLYQDELIIEFEKGIINFSEISNSRREYQLITYYLTEMLKIKDSKERVIKIVQQLKIRYPRKRALQDELDFFVNRRL